MLNVCSKILVPYDNSELSKKALDTAIALAKHEENIELNVITVIDVHGTIYYYGNGDPVTEAQLEAAKESLSEVERKLKALPNKTETFIVEGRPANTIVDFVKQDNADLVVMGSRGLSGLKEMFLGSVSHYVVQHSTCPVYIVK
ncbi:MULTISPECIES: universal stress protein [Bacillaceae]|uniref:Nucleotide-binding universal stress UspA family protein n=1 Tax=Peribacillus huizhouensis TaxID=1501239 RepID=A0ABR6CSK4_9BACI|nr:MULTISPECIES: universal stress protein [Bacillaceae]MBA9027643.1 nucleotide-binding universal stress UspA family protein [Peribacillus huizhouensis]